MSKKGTKASRHRGTEIKRKLLILLTMVVFSVLPLQAEPIDQYHSSWHLVRETADQDGASFAVVYDLTGVDQTIAGNFASKNSSTVLNGGAFRIPTTGSSTGPHEGYSAGTRWMFVMCAKNYDVGEDNIIDNTFSFNLVGWSKTNGMLQVIAEGNVIIGTQAVIIYPDGGDAVGELISKTGVSYNNGNETYTVTDEGFAGAVVGMVAYVTGTNLDNGFYGITTVTDSNNIIMTGMSSSGINTDSTVEINPAFWVDSITLDETTKWTSHIDGAAADSGNEGALAVLNHNANEVAAIVVDLTGLEWIQFVIYAADAATGVQAGDVTVYGRRY